MLVSEIMDRDVLSVSPDDRVTRFMSLMENKNVHEAPVLEGKKLVGMIRFDTLVKKGITEPNKQKIRNLMDFPPATLAPENTIEEAADLLFRSGLRALPVLDGKAVVGVVSTWDILVEAAKTKTFRQTKAEAVMSVAEVVAQDSDIGTARVMMRERGISRLPVVDNSGKLVGVLAVNDLLKAIRSPREKMAWYGMAAEMERIVSLPVSNIMNDRPPTAGPTENLSELVRLMDNYKHSGITITQGSVPIGVVTVKDLLEVYVAGLAAKGVYYHAIGLEGEDEATTDTIHREIRDTLQKVATMTPVQFAFLHFKRHEAGGLRTKWSVRVRVRTAKGMLMSKAWAWDARDAARQALGHLERGMVKGREENRTKLRRSMKKMKEALRLEVQ